MPPVSLLFWNLFCIFRLYDTKTKSFSLLLAIDSSFLCA
ncbi:hypothetical protein MCP1_8620001 [Candidatus Terasakiella magnetica]|nr:hypothetical protein MCP1_8620001 [Candidatus Terasakiella magnetica]